MPVTPDHFILICTTCKGTAAAKRMRADLVDHISERYALRAVACMAGCDRSVTVGFQAPEKTQYMFGDIETAADIEALARFSNQYLASETGWSKASERPEQLYGKTLARLPACKPEVMS